MIRALVNKPQERTHRGLSIALKRRLQILAGEWEKDASSVDAAVVPKTGALMARAHAHSPRA
jgi:hypothetical protein